jgi:hypothetical protein
LQGTFLNFSFFKIATDKSIQVPLKELVTVFDQFSLVEHLIPHIGADPSMRKYVISLYLTKISSSTAESERLALEKDLR